MDVAPVDVVQLLLDAVEVLALDVADHGVDDVLGHHQISRLGADAMLRRAGIRVQELAEVLDDLGPHCVLVDQGITALQHALKLDLVHWHKTLAPGVDQRDRHDGRRTKGSPSEEVWG